MDRDHHHRASLRHPNHINLDVRPHRNARTLGESAAAFARDSGPDRRLHGIRPARIHSRQYLAFSSGTLAQRAHSGRAPQDSRPGPVHAGWVYQQYPGFMGQAEHQAFATLPAGRRERLRRDTDGRKYFARSRRDGGPVHQPGRVSIADPADRADSGRTKYSLLANSNQRNFRELPRRTAAGAGVRVSIAIVGGTGPEGSGLALRWARAGETIIIGSRDAQRALETAGKLSASAGADKKISGTENRFACSDAEIVVLTVPFAAHAETLKHIKPSLRSVQILVDTTVPLAASVGGKPTRTLGVWQGSAAQQAAELVPEGVIVVAAFHNLAAELLQQEGAIDCDVIVCSDDKDAGKRVRELARKIP